MGHTIRHLKPGLIHRETLMDTIQKALIGYRNSNQDDRACSKTELEALAKAGDIDLKKLDKLWESEVK